MSDTANVSRSYSGGILPAALVPARPVSPIEAKLLALLERECEICGTAEVGFALWPDHDMQRKGAAIAAAKILGKLRVLNLIAVSETEAGPSYSVSALGRIALEDYRASKIDKRQLSLLD